MYYFSFNISGTWSHSTTRCIHDATYSLVPTELYPRFNADSTKFIPMISPVHMESASRQESLHIPLRISLTAMWIQQCKPNCLCRLVGKRATTVACYLFRWLDSFETYPYTRTQSGFRHLQLLCSLTERYISSLYLVGYFHLLGILQKSPFYLCTFF